VAWCSS